MKCEFLEIDNRYSPAIMYFQQTENEEKAQIIQDIRKDTAEWVKRISQYIRDINAGTFKLEQVPALLDDMIDKTFMLRAPRIAREFDAIAWGKSADSVQYNLKTCDAYVELRSLLPKITKQLAEHYKCREEQIFIGDYVKGEEVTCDYVVILGDLRINRHNNLRKAPNLKFVSGDVSIGADTDIDCLNCKYKHKYCNEGCYLLFSDMCDFNIEVIGGSLVLNGCTANLKSLRSIGESLNLKSLGDENSYCEFNSLIRIGNSLSDDGLGPDVVNSNFDFPALKSIGGSLYSSLDGLKNANVEYIGGDVWLYDSIVLQSNNTISIQKPSLKYVGGRIEVNTK